MKKEMTLEERISALEKKYKYLSNTVLGANKTQRDINGNVETANAKVDSITPYKETKTAYYGEREKTFYDVPMGNITVQFDNYNGNYSVGRIADRVKVSFDTLTEQTNITISVL